MNLSRFSSDQRGNVAMTFALCAIPLLFAMFGVVDMMGASGMHANLQSAVDAGALAGATRLSVANTGVSVSDTAIRVAQDALDAAHVGDKVTFTVSVTADGSSVTVTGQTSHKPMIGFMSDKDPAISATATAENLGAVPLCVLQTGKAKGGINLSNNARIRATGCAVHANKNIKVAGSALIQADRTQAVGTIIGPVSPAGDTGAMRIEDPFAGLSLKPPTAWRPGSIASTSRFPRTPSWFCCPATTGSWITSTPTPMRPSSATTSSSSWARPRPSISPKRPVSSSPPASPARLPVS
ncbi:MAG: pilus assembly protein [Asticcacaulis sp.]|nr:pilus assembly protein [Asticcacaulis sp.]